jgi:spore germination protein YaaH
MYMKYLLVVLCALAMAVPHNVVAADIKVSGWVPYWSSKTGTKSAIANIHSLSEVYPFVYSIKRDGSLKENAKLKGKDWQKLSKSAKSNGVQVIPTIMTGDGEMIDSLLNNTELRSRHISEIIKAVEKGKFDGIDIDYENRSKVSKDSFSIFLKDLKKALGKKKLVCTLEPRTPPASLWKVVPDPLPYSNDYGEINKYCDLIQIMAYDQQRADLTLNKERAGMPYYPVADSAWVEKVVNLTDDTLDKNKLMLGTATYGRHVLVTVSPDWFQDYAQLGAVNEHHALEIAEDNTVTPSRHESGEMVVTYVPKSVSKSIARKISKQPVPEGTPSGMKAAAQALAYANETGETVMVHMVWWSDAGSITQKVDMATRAGWRGVSVFKIDGQEPDGVWDVLSRR